MVTKNDITGDTIKSKLNNKAYEDGWERIFGNKDKELIMAVDPASENGDYSCEAIVKLMDEGCEVLSVKPLGKI